AGFPPRLHEMDGVRRDVCALAGRWRGFAGALLPDSRLARARRLARGSTSRAPFARSLFSRRFPRLKLVPFPRPHGVTARRSPAARCLFFSGAAVVPIRSRLAGALRPVRLCHNPVNPRLTVWKPIA
ncbi:hypothetical protein, partial [Paraburkholderia sp.]|uniref:hypothetical protein n=1 Tax=Paraburkholderia sp. TaxID=1926495 RepID=UPI0025FDA267